MAAAFVLPTMAQGWNNQQQKQRGLHTMPSAAFQSTSTMSGSGSSYSSNPMLNSDGTAAYNDGASSPAKAPGGPHRAPDPISLDDDIPEGGGLYTPLGDAALPLLLMSLAFCGYIYLRRKRAAA